MNPEPHDPVESIFAAALALPVADRPAFLESACSGDQALCQRAQHLLQAHAEAAGEGFLTGPYAPAATAGPTEGPGTRIGPYKLLQQIGEGGMGVVYMAEQEQPVRRRVALKIIKPGMDSGQVIARFEAERQALAMMDHQNIARVLDAGATPSGRPYFVMELVHGIPITQFCDQKQLSPRQRLELFIPVCQAIQHAHQKGIIHRDIKPSNVLVTMYDDKPVPKLIDFGVAKAIEQRLTEKTLFTQFGAFIGTFEYMSPEQAELNAFGVDTRSDIYSLGVLLYELLTGTTPLERARLRQAALDEVIRLIREEEPPRPSVRLSSIGDLPGIAAARHTEPGRLATLVQGELDWIVMRCLEKDRSRRYDTASALAKDAERYLRDEAVEACPPSAVYRLRKFGRKHRGPLVAASLVFLALLGGMIGTMVGWRRAVQSEERERETKVEAQAARDDAEGSLARSLIGPLDPNGGDVLNNSEWEALWQLTRLDHDRVRSRYLEEGLASEMAAGQLCQRTEWVLNALVGLDQTRREVALQQLITALRAGDMSDLIRSRIASVGLELTEHGSPEERELSGIIARDWKVENTGQDRRERALRLVEFADCMEPHLMALTLTNTLREETDTLVLPALAMGLVKVAPRLAPTEATKLLRNAIAKEIESNGIGGYPREELAKSLAAVATRQIPAEGIKLLTELLGEVRNKSVCRALADGLVVMAARLPAIEATQLLTDALVRETDPLTRLSLIDGLAVQATRLPPSEGAQFLTDILGRENEGGGRRALALGLAALATGLTPAEASRVCEPVAQLLASALEKEKSAAVRRLLAEGLASLAPFLTRTEATRICEQSVQILSKAMDQEKNVESHRSLACAIAAVAARLPPIDATRYIINALAQEKGYWERRAFADALTESAARMTPSDGARLLQRALEKEAESDICQKLAEGLSRVAAGLPTAEATQMSMAAGRYMTAILIKEKDAWACWNLVNGLDAVATRLPPAEARSICATVAPVLIASLGQETVRNSRWAIANGLAEMETRLAPAEADHVLFAIAASEWLRIGKDESTNWWVRSGANRNVGMLLGRLNDRIGKRAAWILCCEILSQPDVNLIEPFSTSGPNLEAVETLFVFDSTASLRKRAIAESAAISLAANGSLLGLTDLSAACEPLPCRLTTQEIVELLKYPTCVGKVRRLLLDQLGNRYHRRFASQWDFVRYAKDQGLDLDFTSPPKRPPSKLPPWPGE